MQDHSIAGTRENKEPFAVNTNPLSGSLAVTSGEDLQHIEECFISAVTQQLKGLRCPSAASLRGEKQPGVWIIYQNQTHSRAKKWSVTSFATATVKTRNQFTLLRLNYACAQECRSLL